MSFGWSAGDVAQAIKLLYNLAEALDSVGGAAHDYREAVIFLRDLSRTLTPLEKLKAWDKYPSYAKEISDQVKHIQIPVGEFLTSVLKYEPSLGATAPQGRHRKICRKLQWYLWKENKVLALKNKIERHMRIIDTLMERLTLDVVETIQERLPDQLEAVISEVLPPKLLDLLRDNLMLLREDAEKGLDSQKQFYEALMVRMSKDHAELLSTINGIKSNLASNALEQQRIESSLRSPSLYKKPKEIEYHDKTPNSDREVKQVDPGGQTGSANTPQESLRDVYMLVLLYIGHFLKNLFLVLSRFLKPQRALMPVLLAKYNISFLDAIGSPLRILPYEYIRNFQMLQLFIKEEFKTLPGSTWVDRGRYQLMSAMYNRPLSEENWSRLISPGARITMAMVVRKPDIAEKDPDSLKCPAKSCPGTWKRLEKSTWMNCPVCQKEVFTSTDRDLQHHHKRDYNLRPQANPKSRNSQNFPGVTEISDFSNDDLEIDDPEVDGLSDDIDIEVFRRIVEISVTSSVLPPSQHNPQPQTAFSRMSLEEYTCRRKLTAYEVVSIQRVDPRDPSETPTWDKAVRMRETLPQNEIVRQIQQLNKSVSVTTKKKNMRYFQKAQVDSVMRSLNADEKDRRFHWTIAQIDQRFRHVGGGKKETRLIKVYAERAPHPETNAILLLREIENRQQQELKNIEIRIVPADSSSHSGSVDRVGISSGGTYIPTDPPGERPMVIRKRR